MNAKLTRYDQAAEFLEDVGPVLYARATVNHLMLGICERLAQDPQAYRDPFFAAVKGQADDLLLAVVMTPPQNLILAEGAGFQQGLAPLIDYLLSQQMTIPGVIGPVQCAEAFYDRWTIVSGQDGEVTMYQRVYELRHVHLPKLPPGHFRVARGEDAPLIADWLRAFNLEALSQKNDLLNLEWAERLVREGKVFLWEDDGRPVSMAMKNRPIKHSITVSAVYTPPEHRRRGYASALVARLSQHLLDMGNTFITLFTDLDNPTSNAIYQKIGYRPVIDFRSYRFIKK